MVDIMPSLHKCGRILSVNNSSTKYNKRKGKITMTQDKKSNKSRKNSYITALILQLQELKAKENKWVFRRDLKSPKLLEENSQTFILLTCLEELKAFCFDSVSFPFYILFSDFVQKKICFYIHMSCMLLKTATLCKDRSKQWYISPATCNSIGLF